MKTKTTVYRMKLTNFEIRAAIGILNEKRLTLRAQGKDNTDVCNLLTRFLDLLPA